MSFRLGSGLKDVGLGVWMWDMVFRDSGEEIEGCGLSSKLWEGAVTLRHGLGFRVFPNLEMAGETKGS